MIVVDEAGMGAAVDVLAVGVQACRRLRLPSGLYLVCPGMAMVVWR